MKKIIQSLSKWKICLYTLFALLYSLQGLLLSLLIQIVGKIDVNNQRMLSLFAFGSITLFVIVYACMYLNNLLARSLIKDFNLLISKRALFHFYKKQLNYSASELNSFLTQDIPMFWQEYLVPLLVFPVYGLSITVSMLYLLMQHVQIGLLFIIGGFLMIIPQFVFKRLLQKSGEELSQAREKSLASITDFTKGVVTIRSNQASENFSNHVMAEIRNTESKQYQYYTSHNLVMFWTGPLKGIGLVVPLVLGLFLMESTNLSLTTLLAMMTASMNLISPLQQLLEVTSNLQSATVVKEKMIHILNMEESECKTEPILSPSRLNICIKNLQKQFQDKIIFQDMTVHILAGQKILLTGASGSGKSTLFSLICGEDIDYSGDIYFINETGEVFLPSYDSVSFIHQKPYIFGGTLRENLTLFQKYSDEQLQEVLERVHLWNELEQNLDFYLDGQNISGGQIMRLEIARCLLRIKPIVLADEVTAALDEQNAVEIRALLSSLDSTVIEIAHKFKKENYDSIYQLENRNLVKLSY